MQFHNVLPEEDRLAYRGRDFLFGGKGANQKFPALDSLMNNACNLALMLSRAYHLIWGKYDFFVRCLKCAHAQIIVIIPRTNQIILCKRVVN
jgi:hypothetical protein